MRSYPPPRRRSGWTGWLVGGTLFTLLLGGGILATLWLFGVNLNPFAGETAEDPFMVRIPINAQPIPAYSRVEREHLLLPSGGGIAFQRVPPDSTVGMSIVGVDAQGSHVEDRVAAVKNVDDQVVFVTGDGHEVRQARAIRLGGALLNLNEILGRVVKRDKRAGMGFQESTFFPPGTPEGLAGATPDGMRAVTLDATKLTGVHALNAGDRIDLMASLPLGEEQTVSISLPNQSSNRDASRGGSEPVLLAQDAMVLKPVYVRNEASTSSSLTQGTRVQNIPKYEVAIAVAADDVIPLQDALNRSLKITCITQSMKPKGDAPAVTPTSDPGMVTVPVTVRPIFAYNVVSRDAFVSPATRRVKTESLSRQQADRMGVITSLDNALGAITRHDVPAGRYLRHSDLLSGPPNEEPTDNDTTPLDARDVVERRGFAGQAAASNGAPHATPDGTRLVTAPTPETRSVSHRSEPRTDRQTLTMQAGGDTGGPTPQAMAVGDRPALTRFIPPGRTAFAIPWNRLYGGEHLQIGDRIDLMASFSLRSERREKETETRPDGTVIVRESDSLSPRTTERTWDESFGFRGEPWFVASDAIVIAPLGFPAPASALRELGGDLSRGRSSESGSDRNLDGPPVVVAVQDQDAEAVAAALVTDDALLTVALHPANDSLADPPRDKKRIVVTPQAVTPFEALGEDLWKGNRRRLPARWVPTDDPRFETAIELDQVHRYFGRVFAVAKAAGEPLTPDDFLSPDAEPGLAAAARTGHTLFAVADREIEGLENLRAGDRVTILRRGVVNPAEGVEIFGVSTQRPIATVVTDARLTRASQAGQTVLELRNEDQARLQAALADSLTDEGAGAGAGASRSHLVAVALPRERSDAASDAPNEAPNDDAHDDTVAATPPTSEDATSREPASTIPSYDPLAGTRYTEVIIGGERKVYGFGGTRATMFQDATR